MKTSFALSTPNGGTFFGGAFVKHSRFKVQGTGKGEGQREKGGRIGH